MLISLLWKGGKCSLGTVLIAGCLAMYVCVVYYVLNLDHPAVNHKLGLLHDFYYIKFLIFIAAGVVFGLVAALGWDCVKAVFRESNVNTYF
jgi:hypothetical protein